MSPNVFLHCVTVVSFLESLSYVQAGGLSGVIVPIVEMVLSGNSMEAKKLAFAQELLSGIPDAGVPEENRSFYLLVICLSVCLSVCRSAGSWGGEALSDTAVRISARNKECCRVLSAFLDEFQRCCAEDRRSTLTFPVKGGALNIAVLYGAYHINDLSIRFVDDLGLTRDNPNYAVEWSADRPNPPQALSCWSIKKSSFGSRDNSAQTAMSNAGWFPHVPLQPLLVLFSGVGLYLFLGAMDWLLLCDLLAKALQVSVEGQGAVRELLGGWAVDSTVLAALYLMFYIQRHLYLLRQIGSVGIQWDRGLFLDI